MNWHYLFYPLQCHTRWPNESVGLFNETQHGDYLTLRSKHVNKKEGDLLENTFIIALFIRKFQIITLTVRLVPFVFTNHGKNNTRAKPGLV